MASNKNKVDQLHDLLPKHLNTRGNTNWKALIEALGQADSDTANLVAEVRKQFFIKTASRPYLDRLAANSKISRPRVVGMDDVSFRQYVPVLSYQPKQVKLIIDKLLDIFFFKESTTAFVTSEAFEPFNLTNNWELKVNVDEQAVETIKFRASDFTDINNASAEEIASAINRQSKNFYATAYYDSITKNTFIRMFTNTIGSKGSLRIVGGQANVALRFQGFISTAGNGANTEWTVSKIGDQVTFQHSAGTAPGINQLQVGDVVIINLSNNQGSFAINSINLADNSITFINLFGTPGVFTQTSDTDVKFFRPQKFVAYLNPRHAMTWETSPGEIIVEMPTSPPVVKRSLKGSMHVNGSFSLMSNRDSNTSLTVVDAFQFPESGTFLLERVNEIKTHVITPTEDTILSKTFNTRLTYDAPKYEYASRLALSTTGNLVEGAAEITNLASIAGLSIGNQVIMNGLPPYTQVINIIGNTAYLSQEATLTANTQSVKFLGNTLTGITPNLPELATLTEVTLTSLSRTSGVVTGTASAPHGLSAGDAVILEGSSGIPVFTTTGDTVTGSNTITNLASVAGISQGQLIEATGVPAGATVISVGANSLTMSTTATANGTGVAISLNTNINGTYELTTASGTTFTFQFLGPNGTSTDPGGIRIEQEGLANSGSKVIVRDSVSNQITRITGAYMWDLSAPFTLSSNTGETLDAIQAGKIIRLLNTDSNTIPAEGGSIIFDYGRNNQEGPIRYLYKPTSNTIALDPSYTFQHSHPAGSPIVHVSKKGPHVMSGKANEYPAYITDPSEARIILEELIRSVKSAGIFVNFLVRFPEQLYGVYDVYNQNGNGAGQPF